MSVATDEDEELARDLIGSETFDVIALLIVELRQEWRAEIDALRAEITTLKEQRQ